MDPPIITSATAVCLWEHAPSGEPVSLLAADQVLLVWRVGRQTQEVQEFNDGENGLSTDELRQDANLRKYIADEMNQLRISVDGALEDLPRRKIRLAA